MTHRQPSLQGAPWDGPKIGMPPPVHIDDRVSSGPPFIAKPRPHHIERLVVQTFNRNNLGQQDLQYMAQALLQLLDKCHELEARVKALEAERLPRP